MDPKQLIDTIEDMSRQAHYLLLVMIANHLPAAVDEDRIGAVVLQ